MVHEILKSSGLSIRPSNIALRVLSLKTFKNA